MPSIAQLVIPYPDFVDGTIINSQQFDDNNASIVDKINEISTALENVPDLDGLETISNTWIFTQNPRVQAASDSDRVVPRDYVDSLIQNIPTPTADTWAANKKYVDDGIANAMIGVLPFGSVTNDYLAADVKVGSLASLTTTATSDVVSAINEVDANANVLDNTTNYGNTVSGTDTLTITTVNGGFTFAVGKSLRGIAVANNTGAMTVDVDGDGAKDIKKLDGSSYVAVEADDFENNKPFELIGQNDGTDFFLLAPKWGSNIKSVQSGEFNWSGTGTSSNVAISEIKSENSIVIIEQYMVNENASIGAIGARITNNTNLNFIRRVGGSWNGSSKLKWQIIEFNNVKSKQTGIKSIGTTTTEETVTISPINTDKCLLITSQTSDTTGNAITYYESASNVLNSTTLSFYGHFESYVYWQVIEFN